MTSKSLHRQQNLSCSQNIAYVSTYAFHFITKHSYNITEFSLYKIKFIQTNFVVYICHKLKDTKIHCIYN
jgi:hypothetical protein